MLEASADRCDALDEDGRLLWWNDTLAETLGYDDALAGMDVFDVVPADQRADARTAFQHADSFPMDVSVTFDVMTAGGTRLAHEFTGGRIEVDGERVIAGIGRDTTHRLEREQDCAPSVTTSSG